MPNTPRALNWLELIAIVIIVSIALLFRLYGFDQVPPAFNGDEANLSLDAIAILQGDLFLIGPNEGTSGALWLYLLAATFGIFGISIEAARGLAVAVSLAGILSAYALVRILLTSVLGRPQAIAIAAIVGLYLAVVRWYVEFSRIAFSANLGVFIQVSLFAALWVALKTERKGSTLLAGILLGLTAYTYVPFRLTPFVLLLFFLLDGIMRWRSGSFVRTRFKTLAAIAMLGGLLYLPIIITNLITGLGDKTRAFTVFNPVIHQGDPWGLLARSTLANLGGFLPAGLLTSLSRLSQMPITRGMDELSIWLFLLGGLLALWRWRRPEFLFLLVWWGMSIIPSIIAPEGPAPHLRRAIGTAVPAFTLAGIGVVIPLSVLMKARPAWRYPLAAAGLALIVWPLITLAEQTYQRYYLAQLDEAAALANHIYDFELAEIMIEEGGEDTAYILPVASAAGAIFPESSTLAFLYREQGRAAYRYIWDDEETLLAEVQALVAGKSRVGVVRWKVSKHTGADPKRVFDYLLEKWGTFEASHTYQYVDIDYFRLDEPPPEPFLAPSRPIAISFEETYLLSNGVWGQQGTAGDFLWTELSWHKIAASTENHQAALWLEDERGHVVGRVDRPLLNNRWHRQTSEWPLNETTQDFYLIPIDPATPPGTYQLKGVLYTAQEDGRSDRRLAPALPQVGPDLAVPLGQIRILPNDQSIDMAQIPLAISLNQAVDESLTLVGAGPAIPDTLRLGDRHTLQLWWQAQDTIAQDLSISVAAHRDGQPWPLSEPYPLGGPDYPTSAWPPQITIRSFIDLSLPADLPSGNYELQAVLHPVAESSPDNDLIEPVVLAALNISGRPRDFEIPVMGHLAGANFAGQITLLGYDLDLSQPETANLTLYWQAQQEMAVPYKIFIHLLDSEGAIVGQLDQEPQAGEAPTTGWLAGEVIADKLIIPTTDLAQVARIIVGLYNPVDGTRLILDGTNTDAYTLSDD